MSEWKKVRLGEVAEFLNGKSKPKEPGIIPIYGSNGVIGFSNRSLYANAIIVGRVGAYAGSIARCKTDFWPTDNTIIVKPRDGQVDIDFVFYRLQKLSLSSLLGGSAQPLITHGILKDKEFSLPPLPTQRRIAAVLSSLDDKIENNRKICANLEAQAQAIFKSWFVDFEPFGGKMPQGWKEVPLSSIATYLNGLAMQKYRPSDDEDSLPVLKIKELRQGFCDSASERCSASIDPRYVIHDGDVIFSWSGSLLVDFWCGGTAGLNQHLFKVYSDKYDKWFVYSWTNHYLASFIKIAADKATTMGHITRDHLDDAKVCIPFDSDIEQVGRVMKPLYDEIITKRIESRSLAATRDALLPKLMSGEIDVEKVKVA